MAKYLRTSSITAELENLIRNARKELYILSPYLKLSDNIKELLNDKEREKVDVRIIFGKQELAPDELGFLEKLKYVRLYFSKNLHAKCYLNESKMIIASMNLYEFSQQNNREMGILIDTANDEDKSVYEDASGDIESIMFNSEDFSYIKVPQKTLKEKADVEKTNKSINLVNNKYSKSRLMTTKEFSAITGLSSRKINSWFVDNDLMFKSGDDWMLTDQGEKLGGVSKEGQYGKFILWPENITNEIKN